MIQIQSNPEPEGAAWIMEYLFIKPAGAFLKALCATAHASQIHDSVKAADIEKVSKLLKARDCAPDETDDDGWTPLHFAAVFGDKKIAALLIENGANVNAQSKDGSSPLHLAVENNEFGLAEFLISKNALINAQNLDGETPMHIAVNL